MTYLPANVLGRWFHLYLILGSSPPIALLLASLLPSSPLTKDPTNESSLPPIAFPIANRSTPIVWKGAKTMHEDFLRWADSLGLVAVRSEGLSRCDFAFDFHLPEIDFDEDSFFTTANKDIGLWVLSIAGSIFMHMRWAQVIPSCLLFVLPQAINIKALRALANGAAKKWKQTDSPRNEADDAEPLP